MTITKISDKYQVVIPKKEREKLKLKCGQKLAVYVVDSQIVMSPQEGSYTKKLAGLGKKTWASIDPLEYIQKERKQWAK